MYINEGRTLSFICHITTHLLFSMLANHPISLWPQLWVYIRMDVNSGAALMGCAEELHAVMVYRCSVSGWMREPAINTTGCSILVSPIMGQSMAKRKPKHKNKEIYSLLLSIQGFQTVSWAFSLWAWYYSRCISAPNQIAVFVMFPENLHCGSGIFQPWYSTVPASIWSIKQKLKSEMMHPRPPFPLPSERVSDDRHSKPSTFKNRFQL